MHHFIRFASSRFIVLGAALAAVTSGCSSSGDTPAPTSTVTAALTHVARPRVRGVLGIPTEQVSAAPAGSASAPSAASAAPSATASATTK